MKLASTDLQVGQAQSFVSIQADCSRAEAMLLLRRRGSEREEPLIDVARAVLCRRIRFEPPVH